MSRDPNECGNCQNYMGENAGFGWCLVHGEVHCSEIRPECPWRPTPQEVEP